MLLPKFREIFLIKVNKVSQHNFLLKLSEMQLNFLDTLFQNPGYVDQKMIAQEIYEKL